MATEEKINADVIIIGAGIAGLSLALRALQHGLNSVVLDDSRRGATYSATGIIAPRLDYMLKDIDLVSISDRQCELYKFMFPRIVMPQRFLIPINPDQKHIFSHFDSLLRKYDKITPKRETNLPSSSRISQSELERREPKIRRGIFEGAFCLWEFKIDPTELLCEVERLNKKMGSSYTRIRIDRKTLEFKLKNKRIAEIKATTFGGVSLKIEGGTNPLVVVNASGPWIQDVTAPLGINLNIELRLGIQMSVLGYYFQSGIITFDKKGGYCICLPKGNYIQAGPTNTLYTGHPDNSYESRDGFDSLVNNFRSILDPNVPVGECRFLKSGLRVKPNFGDTNRPIIWSHKSSGFENFYTLFPGKMSLGLLAADEMLGVVAKDGWHNLNIAPDIKCTLDGNEVMRNRLFLKAERIKSLAKVGKAIFLS